MLVKMEDNFAQAPQVSVLRCL